MNPEPVRCPIRPLLMMANLQRSIFKETPEEQLEALGLPLSLTKAMITIGKTPMELARLLGREGSPTRNVSRALHPLWYTVDERLSAFARTRETEVLMGILGDKPVSALRGEIRKLRPQHELLYIYGGPGAGKTYAMDLVGGENSN